MEKFWMVFVTGTKGCTKQHSDEEQARAEAERLAKLYPAEKVYLLEAIDFCIADTPVVWAEVERQ